MSVSTIVGRDTYVFFVHGGDDKSDDDWQYEDWEC